MQRAVFARNGSAFFIFEDYYSHLLRLSSYKPAASVGISPFLFNLRLFAGDTELPYTYFSDAASLAMNSDKGSVQFVFTGQEQLRVRGQGVTLRIELCPALPESGMVACHGVLPLADGVWEATFGTYGKFLFVPLKGNIEAYYPWNREKQIYEAVYFDFIPNETGKFEAAIHEDLVEFAVDNVYPSFAEVVDKSLESYERFKHNYLPPAPGYEELWDYAIYQIWSHRTKAQGGFLEPGILFQYTWVAGVFPGSKVTRVWPC